MIKYKADTNSDKAFDMPELMAFIERWKTNDWSERQRLRKLDGFDLWAGCKAACLKLRRCSKKKKVVS